MPDPQAPNPKSTRATGAQGERLAAAYLIAAGLTIQAANWRPAAVGLLGEIDLVAQEGPALVFVEVRTRHGRTPGLAEESVTPAKQARLIALAAAYLQAHAPEQADWRIDVVAVWLPPTGAPVLTWLRGAVEAQE